MLTYFLIIITLLIKNSFISVESITVHYTDLLWINSILLTILNSNFLNKQMDMSLTAL